MKSHFLDWKNTFKVKTGVFFLRQHWILFWILSNCCPKYGSSKMSSHPVTRRRGDVVTTSLCTSQWRCRYVSNETPNDVSVIRLHDVLLVCRNDVSKRQYVSATSQISLKWNTQQRLSGTSPRRLSGTYPRRPTSLSLRRLL